MRKLIIFIKIAILIFLLNKNSYSQVYHLLLGGNFVQDWSNTALITVSDDWSGVSSARGFRGDALTSATGTDPQTIFADELTSDVNANQTAPNTYNTGGVTEFEITDPVIAIKGSGTADAPFVVFYIDATGMQNISVQYKLRDIDGSANDAVMPVALQYRIGATGGFTNIASAFVADATEMNLDTLENNINATLPAECNNQGQIQIRVITANAAGTDEWVGIDNISVSGTAFVSNTVTFTVTDNLSSPVSGASVTVNGQTLTTDVSGVATIDLADGTYPYTVAASGFNVATGNVVVSGSAVAVNVTLTVASTVYTVTFNVTDNTPAAISGAAVSINGQTLVTDTSGAASIDLADGTYPYTVSATGFTDVTGDVIVAGSVTSVNVTMTAIPVYTVTFNVTDTASSAIYGAIITINGQTLVTDTSGIASIDLPDGTYPYTITATGFNNGTGDAVVSGSVVAINVTLTETVVLNGLIISQYIETSVGTEPKGIELWNNTGVDIDFAATNLEIRQGTNGAVPANEILINSGTLLNHAVMVIGTDADVSGTGTGFRTFVEGNGSGFVTHNFTFNGDDALEVWLNGTLQDVVGTAGVDPGTSWSGNGVSTSNQNISLHYTITTGDTAGWLDPSVRFVTTTTDNSVTGFGLAPAAPVPHKLVITSVNGGISPVENTGFDITIEIRDTNNIITNATSDVPVTISLGNGSGTLTGSTTGIIPAGNSGITVSGLLYAPAENGVTLIVADDNLILTSDTSSAFNVTVTATQLVFVNVPASAFTNVVLTSFTVEARNSSGLTDLNYSGDVTISISGGGTLNGTLTVACLSGVATFSDIAFPSAGTFQLDAVSGTLTNAVSSDIIITDAPATADHLVFAGVPASGTVSVVLSSFTVEARTASNGMDTAYTGDVTLSIASGPGTLGGTITKPCTGGIATFDDITVSAAGVVRLLASSSTLLNDTTADININTPVMVSYPVPFDLSTGDFGFMQWDTSNIAGTYPPNMIFHKSATQDPGLTVEMTDDYTGAYNLASGSRINGLGVDGFSFVNTGTSGNLGAAVLALNTTGKNNISVSWLGGTVTTNPREYRIRLQYMIGTSGTWSDFTDSTMNPVEYVMNATNGHTQQFGPGLLPVSCENQPLVFLRWKYYHATGTSGARPNLRVDEIYVTTPTVPVKLAITGVNGGNNPVVNTPFDIIVSALDINDNPSNVTNDVNFSLAVSTGTGALSGTVTGTILSGTNNIVLTGLLYDVAETGVSLTVSDNAATLTSGVSPVFDVVSPPVATSLAITDINGGVDAVVNTPFNVTVQLLDNYGQPFIAQSDVAITINLVTGAGALGGQTTGTILTGTNEVIISGVVYDLAETGVVIRADDNASVLTSGVSGAFTVTNVAVALHIVSVNGGLAPVSGQPFDVSVEAVDANNIPVAVTSDVSVSLSLVTGTGTLGGSTTTTILTGTTSAVIAGVTYSPGETGIIINATDDSLVLLNDTIVFDVTNPVVLQAGDIAIIQYRSDAEDGFSFVALTDIPGGAQISFTDNAFTDMDTLNGNEQTLVWSAPAQGVPLNTVITWQNATGVTIGTVVSGALSGISANGDQVIAYTGSASSPVFLYALSTLQWISTGTTSNNTSYIPTGLINGYSAIYFNPGLDNAYYQVTPITGTHDALLSSISDTLNWLGSDDPAFVFQPDTYWDFTISSGTVSQHEINAGFYPNPVNKEVHINNLSTGDIVKIYDLTGRIVYSLKVLTEGTNSINCEKLETGCYLVTISRSGVPSTCLKLIKN